MQQLPILRLELCAAVLLAKLCGKATLAFTLPSINPSNGQIPAFGTTAGSGAKYGGERRDHPCQGYMSVRRRWVKHGVSSAATCHGLPGMNSCKSRGVGPRWCAGPVGGCGDGKKLSALRHPLCLAPRRKHVVGQMEFIALLPAVRSKEGLNVTPRALDSICVIPGVRINERDRMIRGACNRGTRYPDMQPCNR